MRNDKEYQERNRVFPSNNENPFEIREWKSRFSERGFITLIISTLKRKTQDTHSWRYWQDEDALIFNLLIVEKHHWNQHPSNVYGQKGKQIKPDQGLRGKEIGLKKNGSYTNSINDSKGVWDRKIWKAAVVMMKVRTLKVQDLKKELLPSDKGI